MLRVLQDRRPETESIQQAAQPQICFWSAMTASVPPKPDLMSDLEINLPAGSVRRDAEIAATAMLALESSAAFDALGIAVSVEDGVVTLSGTVDWNFQKDDAERVTRRLWGVTGVNNQIAIRARAILAELKQEIQRALARTAGSAEPKIRVEPDPEPPSTRSADDRHVGRSAPTR
jgi:hypothetical protein